MGRRGLAQSRKVRGGRATVSADTGRAWSQTADRRIIGREADTPRVLQVTRPVPSRAVWATGPGALPSNLRVPRDRPCTQHRPESGGLASDRCAYQSALISHHALELMSLERGKPPGKKVQATGHSSLWWTQHGLSTLGGQWKQNTTPTSKRLLITNNTGVGNHLPPSNARR